MSHIRGLELFTPTPVASPVSLIEALPTLDSINAELAKRSLRDYVELVWPIIEPGTTFLGNWHIDLICEYLEAVTAGEIKRLLITVPPRYMKSNLVSVAWPTWEWISDPRLRYVFSSYSSSLSNKHSLDRRTIIQSDWYKQNYGHIYQLAGDQNTKTEFENTERGRMVATSVGGTLTGKGGLRLVMDDPHNPTEAASDTQRLAAINYFDQTFSTRLDSAKTGAIVVVQQRLHEKDLAGHLLAKGDWEHLCIPLVCEEKTTITAPRSGVSFTREKGDILWPERDGEKEIEQKKSDLGAFGFASQMQQAPAPAEGNVVKKFWFNYYNVTPRFALMLQSWDCNFKKLITSDYVCGQIWGAVQNRKYLVEMFKQKTGIVGTLQAIADMTVKYPEAITKLIEDKANGSAVMELFEDKIEGLIPVEPQGGKEARVAAVSPIIEAGNVYLPCIGDPTEWNNTPLLNRTQEMFDNVMKPLWVEDFIKSCAIFPKGENDDDVDAATQALLRLKKEFSTGEILDTIAIGKSLAIDLEI